MKRRYTLKTLIDTPLKRALSPSSFAMAALEGREGGGIGDLRAGTGAPPQPHLGIPKRRGRCSRAQRAAPSRRVGLWSGGWPHGLLRARPPLTTPRHHVERVAEAGRRAACQGAGEEDGPARRGRVLRHAGDLRPRCAGARYVSARQARYSCP